MSALDDLATRHPHFSSLAEPLGQALLVLVDCFKADHTVYVCGNGGSAADAEHIVGELMKGMTRRRPIPEDAREALVAAAPEHLAADAGHLAEQLDASLRAVCLSSQSALLTAVINDQGADLGFAQQVYGYGRPGDVLWALSTSGRSRNVLLAALAARARTMSVLALTGVPGQPLGGLADVWISVPATDVGGIQELHRPVYHALCQALEDELFPGDPVHPPA